ncbi:MAG TPA: LLM class flavin-dependent oxidoreductase [Candidatus Dormibacteraeota bacterium]|nr:LLM class flavin-dependent oxidoreductase [Candidatus Dormibacteraeota bacterium]
MARLAANNNAGRSLEDSVQRTQEAERLGYESVWVTQLPDARDAALVLAAYAGATKWVRLGTGVLPIYTRHPTAMAQMAATLDELSGGRFILGLGVSHKVTVESMWGLKLDQPVESMREYLNIVRASLRDGAASVDGGHFTAHWSYSAPRRSEIPVMISALSPRMLELAGELADGVVLWMCTPKYIHDVVVPHVAAGREKAGKSIHGFEVVAAITACLTTDRGAALEVFRRTVERYASLPYYRKAMDASGFQEDLAAGRVTDAMLDELSGIGDESRVRDVVRRYRESGTTLPCILTFGGHPGAAGYVPTLEAAREA